MTQAAETNATTTIAVRGRLGASWSAEKQTLAVFAVATLAAWAHTIDEIRIGELIAMPFGAANAAFAAAWPRLRRAWQVAVSIGFGLFWSIAVIPYHVVPLLGGQVTGQNISGLSRLVGGGVMVGLGIAIARRGRGEAPPAGER